MNRSFAEFEGQDAYELLGVADDSSTEEIQQAFRRKIRLWHPDKQRNPGKREEAERQTRLLTMAREVLLTRRSEYDSHRRQPTEPDADADLATEPEELIDDPWDEADYGTQAADPWSEADIGTPRPPPPPPPPIRTPPPPWPVPPPVPPYMYGYRPPVRRTARRRVPVIALIISGVLAYVGGLEMALAALVGMISSAVAIAWWWTKPRRARWLVVFAYVGLAAGVAVKLVSIVTAMYLPAVAVPKELAGRWSGVLRHTDSEEQHVVRVFLRAGKVNGGIDYPLSKCDGILIPQRISPDGRLILREEILRGRGICSEGELEVRNREGKKIGIRYLDSESSDEGPALDLTAQPDSPATWMHGTWKSDKYTFVMDDKTPGLAGTVEKDGKAACLLAPLSTGDKSAKLATGSSCPKPHGTWKLTKAGEDRIRARFTPAFEKKKDTTTVTLRPA